MNKKISLSVLLFSALLLSGSEIKIPEISLDLSNKPQQKSVDFPLVEKKAAQIPVLKARIYFNVKTRRGWNNTMQLFLNNRKLTSITRFGKQRLLRREAMRTVKSSVPRQWYSNSGWLVMFGPGEGEIDSRIQNNRQEGYWYYFDISDLVHYIGDNKAKSNQFLVGCLLTLKLVNVNTPLTLKDIEIIYLDETKADQFRIKSEDVSR